jgi:hypothetical protein
VLNNPESFAPLPDTRMPFSSIRPLPAVQERVSLLAQVVEVLVEELSTLAASKWEDLPDLKKKKVVLASRLDAVNWAHAPLPREAFDLMTLRNLITELENHSRRKIQSHMELIGNQFFALQEQHLYWRECLSVSFRRFCEAIPSA